MYHCCTCGEFKPYEEFYKNKSTILGITSECKKCHCTKTIATRNKDNARAKNREYMKRARLKDPERFRKKDRERHRPKDEKQRARMLLNIAVRDGKISKPRCCSDCGKETELQGHHSDYSKPYEVEWLCSLRHGKRHRKEFERCEKP